MRRVPVRTCLVAVGLASAFGMGLVSRPHLARLRPPPPPAPDLTTPVPERGERHRQLLAELGPDPAPCDVLLLGDSITEGWAAHPAACRRAFGPSVVNWGVAWDRVENVLWRVQDGVARVRPKRVVVWVGSNNLSRGDDPKAVAAGVRRLVEELHARLSDAPVTLLSVLPREGGFDSPVRRRIRDCNALLAALPGVEYRDVARLFVTPDGDIRPDLLSDGIHPSPAGYDVLADALVR